MQGLERQETMEEWWERRMRNGLDSFHAWGIVLMGALYILGSYTFPMIDHGTLKPNEDFPLWLKKLSYYSNVPIKIGAVHTCLYGIEFFRDRKLFSRHVGQRLTTLWVQFLEHPRWGQHLHMQTETLLQIFDIFSRSKPKDFSDIEVWILRFFVVLFALTNYLTSMGYHTFFEQTLGFVLCLAKLWLDYTPFGLDLNSSIGDALNSLEAIVGGAVALLLAHVLVYLSLQGTGRYEDAFYFLTHPTGVASCMFLGGLGVTTALKPARAME